MSSKRKQRKRGRGRPVTKPTPELIPDSPENVLQAVLATPPRKADGWKYLKRP